MRREFKQIIVYDGGLIAVANDGTAWHREFIGGGHWRPIDPLPDIPIDKLPKYRLDDYERDR